MKTIFKLEHIEELKNIISYLSKDSSDKINVSELMKEIENTSTVSYSFWELLDDFEIEIPIIQRDYAQGRDTEKVKEIRERFISKILDAIEKNKKINLDFIYGKTTNSKFIPLDGQQRLTTLFLVHWYLARANKPNEREEKLSKFTYKTRISSRDFCSSLVKDNIQIIDFNENKIDTYLSNQIENCSWFFLSWKKDPTIKSMLVVLDTIHKKISGKDYNKLWNNLTSKEKRVITFQFLNMDSLSLTDELYIKMNARGKQLTEFENFKAWFEDHIEDFIKKNKYNLSEFTDIRNNRNVDWKEKIDTDWTDLFWKYKDDENNLIDEEYIRFFKGMALFKYFENFNSNNKKDALFEALISVSEGIDTYIPTTKYEELNSFDEDTIKKSFKILEYLKNDNNETVKKYLDGIIFFFDDNKDTKSIFQSFISRKITYYDRIIFYALMNFLIMQDKEPNDWNDETINEFKRLMRVVRNLAINSGINRESIGRLLISIKKILNSSEKIYVFLTNDENKVEGFNEYQLDEERLKAKLITKKNEWEEEFLNIENHNFFQGQIKFLVDISMNENGYDLDIFKKYTKLGGLLFEKQDDLLRRALLSKGHYYSWDGYTYSVGAQRYTLLNVKPEWKWFLRDNNKNNIFLDLLNSAEETHNNRSEILNSVINSFTDENDWRYHIIRNEDILKNCKNKRFCKNESSNELDKIYLLNRTRVRKNNYRTIGSYIHANI